MTTSITEAPPAVEPTAAQQLAADLRALADMVEANPEIGQMTRFQFAFDRMLVSVNGREEVVALARAGIRTAGVRVAKHQGERWAGVDLHFGGRLSLHVYTDREDVCERIVTGTREVVEEIPDPEALAAVPKVTVTKTVEEVEWRCMPLLAPDDQRPAIVQPEAASTLDDRPQATIVHAEAASPLSDQPRCRHCDEAIAPTGVNDRWVDGRGRLNCSEGPYAHQPPVGAS